MSAFQQFGQRRPGIVGLPHATPELGEANNLAAIGQTIFQAFSTAQAGAQAATAATVRGQREQAGEDQLEIARERAVTEELTREQTRVLLINRELEAEFEDLSDLEFFGVQELFARGTEETKTKFLAEHRWADPKNQAKIEGFFGRQLATTDWFRAQKKIQEFYMNPANAEESLRVSEMMRDFLLERSDLPPGAAIAYQQQFMGQVGNFIFQQEAARAGRRSKEIREQRGRNDIAQAGLYFSGNASLVEYAQVVSDGISLVEGDEGDPGTLTKLLTDHMAASSGAALAKLVGVVPTSELRARIADLPDAVKESAEIKFIETELIFADRRSEQKGITQEAANIKTLSTRFAEANDIRSLVMLRSRVGALPAGSQKRQVSDLLESRITQLDEGRNFQINIMERGADVSINDISNLQSDLSFERPNYQRASRTLREIGEVDRNLAFQTVADLKNGVIGDMLIRAKPQEVNDLVGVLSRSQTRNLLAGVIEQKNNFLRQSSILSNLSEAVPTDAAISRYGDRFTRHMLDVQTREIDPILDPGAAADEAARLVTNELKTDFVKLRTPFGRSTYGQADLFGVGSIRETDKAGRLRLNGALTALTLEARRQGDISPNTALAFEHRGKTYVPATGNGRAGAYMEWDQRTQQAKLVSPNTNLTLFRQLNERLAESASELDLVSNSDVRWRESYGTRFISQFDQAYFPNDPSGGIGSWMATEAQRRWFDQMGTLPRLDVEGLEGRELEEVQQERDVFRSFMNIIALEHGWTGLDPLRVPPGVTGVPSQLPGATVPLLQAQAGAEQKALETFNQQVAAGP